MFKNDDIFLPNQEFVFYKSFNTLAGNHIHNNWIETFSIMCNDIKKLDFDIALVSCGGYGLPICNFIKNDMKKSTLLIDLVEFLKKENKILEVLSLGSTKFLGVIPANPDSSSNFVKHLDIRLIPTESRIPAYFFYTSGGKFNQMIRQIAKDKGFTLSEFDLKDSEGKIVKVKSEEEIFEKLGVNFIPMEDRRAL
jgi:hypothetical protein